MVEKSLGSEATICRWCECIYIFLWCRVS